MAATDSRAMTLEPIALDGDLEHLAGDQAAQTVDELAPDR